MLSNGGSIFNPPAKHHLIKHLKNNTFDCNSAKSGGSGVVGLSIRLRDLKFKDKQDKLFEKINRLERKENELRIHTNK